MSGTTPGWKTSEFWVHLASQIAVLWGAVQGFIPARYAAILAVAGSAVYTVARTILKAVTDIKAVQGPAEPATATATATVSTP